ncbi:MAG: oligoribonuclease [Candidatus Muproteobacteria bacterium RBG_16_62_13]|uniref:Oligoribonuclease n=1 Tax=Candidatus Muproteobacteria bacterium RBG_16_62_13 TaxID=1817756 RepID=A0A1F6T4P4_9PROT|nr:MAG: oligoribonuclease [Candidatus Muproteobacteria bacterium RBG_16_62_13]
MSQEVRAANGNNLIWIDLEMTGLDPAKDRIIEVATIVTDAELNIVAEGPVLAVHQPDEIMASMDEWNTRTHAKTGLTERVKASTINEAEAERQTIEFLALHVARNKSPMCGNSICQDRRFLARCMPQLEGWFHYRNLDVSSVKELAVRWKPAIMAGFQKKNTHKAIDDIRESIEELKYYREHFIAR